MIPRLFLVISIVGTGILLSSSTLIAGGQLPLPAANYMPSLQPVHYATSYAPVVKRTAPAVVSISALHLVNQPTFAFSHDPFFNFFFGQQGRPQGSPPGSPQGSHQRKMTKSLGSGVIIDPSGIVVTCAHVVENAREIFVNLSDNREFKGKVVARDLLNDLVIIRLENVPANFPLPALSVEQEEIEVGDFILAIGNPFGVGQTVTSGIISAIARNIGGRILIQTDAPINPGNSGGALVSMKGNLIGIPNAIISKTGTSLGIGLAIPRALIQALVKSLHNGGVIVRPWAGINVQKLTPELAAAIGLPTPQGVLVVKLHPFSPARAAGLQQGDVITAINMKAIANQDEFIYRLQSAVLGEPVNLAIFRNNQLMGVTFRPIDPPASPAPDQRRISHIAFMQDIEVANLSPALISKYQLPFGGPEKGVVITDTGKNALARQLKLKKGDIIERLNQQKINSVAELFKALEHFKNPGSLIIRQQNGTIEIKSHG